MDSTIQNTHVLITCKVTTSDEIGIAGSKYKSEKTDGFYIEHSIIQHANAILNSDEVTALTLTT